MIKLTYKVDEPWEHSGKIFVFELLNEISPKQIIVRTSRLIKIEKQKSKVMLISSRYVGDTLKHGNTYKGIANAKLIIGDYEGKPIEEIYKLCGNGFIGSLKSF